MKPILWDPANIFTQQSNVMPNICPSFLSTLSTFFHSLRTYIYYTLSLSFSHASIMYIHLCMDKNISYHHHPWIWNMRSWREKLQQLHCWCAAFLLLYTSSIFFLDSEKEIKRLNKHYQGNSLVKNLFYFFISLSFLHHTVTMSNEETSMVLQQQPKKEK